MAESKVNSPDTGAGSQIEHSMRVFNWRLVQRSFRNQQRRLVVNVETLLLELTVPWLATVPIRAEKWAIHRQSASNSYPVHSKHDTDVLVPQIRRVQFS